MKPDGVDSASTEAAVALGADPVVEVAALGEGQEHAPPTSQTDAIGQAPAEAPVIGSKTGKPKPTDAKAKVKAGAKTKTAAKPATGASANARPAPARMTNGVQKPQTNGMAKKTVPEKKTSTTAAPVKKPAAAPAKTSGTRPAGGVRPATAPANGAKSTAATQAAKKTTGTPANGEKTKAKSAVDGTKLSTTSSPKTDRPPTAKTARTSAGVPTSRPASAPAKPASPATSKTSASVPKPSPVARAATSTAKPSPAKTTAPPAGRTPNQPSKTTTPIKKDVSKPSTPAAKKPAASPLSRPATAKTTKPDAPKATTPAKTDSASKKPSAPGKAGTDAKASKPKDGKPAPSKEVSGSPKVPSAKNSVAKAASPKKTVGSSTPVPVKRGPKATQASEPAGKGGEKEDVAPAMETAAVVTVAAAVGALALATSEPEVQAEPVAELAPEPKSEALSELTPELSPECNSALPAEPQSTVLLESKPEFSLETESEVVPESKPEFLLETESEVVPESKPEFPLETESEVVPESMPEFPLETESEVVPESKLGFPLETESDVVPESKPEFLLETESEIVSEAKPEFLLETEYEIVSESKPEFLLEAEYEHSPKSSPEFSVETESDVVPESKPEFPLEAESDIVPESKPEFLLETECEIVSESKPEFLLETCEIVPDSKPEFLSETESESPAESKPEFLLETESETVSESKPEFLLEAEYEHSPKSKPEFLLETEHEIVSKSKPEFFLETDRETLPESKPEFLSETESESPTESKPEFPLEIASEVIPESKPEFPLEMASEVIPESKHEFLLDIEYERSLKSKPEYLSETESESPTESKPEFLFENKSEFAAEPKFETLVETKTEFLLETGSEIVPELESELQLETKSEFTPKSMSESLFEIKSEFSPEARPDAEIAHESTVDTFIPAAIEDSAQYTEDTKDVSSGQVQEATDDAVTEVYQGSLREPISALSPLGTTVMSPPSSPAEYEAVQVEPKVFAPPPFSTAEDLEEEHTRSQEDLLTPTQSAAEELVDAGKTRLLSASPLEHFSRASPTSPTTEREEEVEKAEQEINEDDHDEEDDEEEGDEEEEDEVEDVEREESEVVKTQTTPETQQVGLSQYDASGWGATQADGAGVSVLPEKPGAASPSQTESPQHDDVDDFFLKKVEMEQAFMGPPGVKSFSDEEEEEEDDDDHVRQSMDFASLCAGKLHMDTGLLAADGHHGNIPHHLKPQEEEEQEDEDVEMVAEGQMEIDAPKGAGTAGEDDYDEGYLDNLNRTAPVPSMPMTAAWGSTNPFADTWAQPASLHMTSSPLDFEADPETPTKSPAEAWLEQPLGASAGHHLDVREGADGPAPPEGSTLAIPAVGMSQSSTLSGGALAAHSSSETSTPEELRDYDSSSGVESHSDKQQTPVPAPQPEQDQDLGIHLERGDGEEEEAETLPADEVLGDAPTAPASAPSSPSSSGDEASDTEGEMQINDPDVPTEDAAAFDSPSASRNLPALDEDEEVVDMHVGEEDGGTPQSANSVASYGFDCSASNSNAHSTAESCGKSPGIFSLENEDQLPEEAKDPSLIKELTLPAAAAHPEELFGRPVDLLPLAQQGESCARPLDHQYLLGEKTGGSALEDVDPELPTPRSPQHDDPTDGQPPYYSAICDKTDSFLAGGGNLPVTLRDVAYLPSVSRQVGDDRCLTPWRREAPLPCLQLRLQRQLPTSPTLEAVGLPAAPPPRAPRAALGPRGQLRRLEQHKLQLWHIQWWQEQRQRGQEEERQRQCEERQRQYEERQRQCEEERQYEERQRQCEEERQRQYEEERQRQYEEERQRQCEEERQRQCEERQRQYEEERQRQYEERQRQYEEERQRQYEEERQRQYEEERQRQYEEERQRQYEEERQRQYEEERQRQYEEERQRQYEEERQRQQLLQCQLEAEQQRCIRQQPKSASPPSTGLCTIYETMETDEDEDGDESSGEVESGGQPCRSPSEQTPCSLLLHQPARLDRAAPVDVVRRLLTQALLLEAGGLPLLHLPGQGDGILSPLESSLWPRVLPHINPTTASVTSVSCYSPVSQGRCCSRGDWTVVELETRH